MSERFGQDWATLLQKDPGFPAAKKRSAARKDGTAKLAKMSTVSEAGSVPSVRTRELFGKAGTGQYLPLNRKTTQNEVREIPVSELEPRQELIPVAGLSAYIGKPRRDPPDVAHIMMRDGRERFIVQEGHTRLGAAKLRGEESAKARVWEFTESADGSFQPVPRGRHRQGLTYRDKLKNLSEWEEDQHPRDEQGRFSDSAGSLGGALRDADGEYRDGPSWDARYEAADLYMSGAKVEGSGAGDARGLGINEHLRAGGDVTDDVLGDDLGHMVRTIDAAIAATPTTKDTTLHRIVSGDFAKTLQPGTVFTDKGYVSTSKTLEASQVTGERFVSKDASTVQMRISVPTGTGHMDFEEIDPHGFTSMQREVLLPRGTTFEVVSRDGQNVTARVVSGKTYRDKLKNLSLPDGEVITMPFADYEDFDDCVAKNQDKDNAKAFCGWLKHRIEGSTMNMPDIADVSFPAVIGAIPSKPAKRKRTKYKGVQLSRRPMKFEVQFLSLAEIPVRLDAARDAIISDDTVLLNTMVEVAAYGKSEVLKELVRQGAPARLADYQLSLEADTLAMALQADRAREIYQLESFYRSKLEPRVSNVERREKLVHELSARRMPALMKRYANRAVNMAFAYGRGRTIRSLRRVRMPQEFELARYRDDEGHFITQAEAVSGGYVIVDAVIQTAVMDTSTCDECSLVDGEVMELGDDRQLELDPPYVKCYGGDNCRCVQIALLEDGSQIDVDEIDEDTID